MEFLNKLGLNPELLDEDDKKNIERVARQIKLPTSNRADPNRLLSAFREAGLDVEAMFKKMRKNSAPKHSSRVKRNDKCPCGSGKKYKKCCI